MKEERTHLVQWWAISWILLIVLLAIATTYFASKKKYGIAFVLFIPAAFGVWRIFNEISSFGGTKPPLLDVALGLK